ncbi:DNA replication/repair protein RecF [Jonesia quinghaiensis]|uniref:DNA replication/repair protein RecF n=1 Tax=Jonesia quinghaiensis TaxID=262806 RepID=UPI000424B319|nr:DNA replication/repair protein RecF [Jonesia quinghaiensis]
MYVSHLSLLDYRSYEHVDLELSPGVNILVGRNGQGKTNLVEAIGYLATLGSHRVSHDQALVRVGAQRAIIKSRVVRGERAQVVELEVNIGKANRARVNRGSHSRASSALGIVKTVLFAPEDLVLVKGDPDARRAYLDGLTVLISPRMRSVLSDYDKVVRQRSALLKSLGSSRAVLNEADRASLAIWDERLVELGSTVIALRQRIVAAIAPHISTSYTVVSQAQSIAHLGYRPSLNSWLATPLPPVAAVEDIQEAFREALAAAQRKELDRGVCLAGPHRDDLEQMLDDLPVKGYASHGESWSYALAMRLASYTLMTQGPDQDNPAAAELADIWWTDSSDDTEPILILDDVFAELDSQRRRQLASIAANARQVIITAAVPQDVPQELVGRTLYVTRGAVSSQQPGPDDVVLGNDNDTPLSDREVTGASGGEEPHGDA